ncbi:uncharacterized protein KQ657_003350 [Scheffersomyces spartinae]|uniref:CBM21 domain-containing protein n=1 Tax=Scheffersomyces spartinae TaxID=45513 RepID=A0A9P7VCI0_9ASCO|nr:uncharacterized protein KQ657_003350 [Scheffersomyces spartinae]KAG7195583.1 hypothetical protein KQ657_003350 [Scheffersomyces spartinae]
MAVDKRNQTRISVEEANIAISQLHNDKPVLKVKEPPQNDHAGLLQRELDKLAIERKQWEDENNVNNVTSHDMVGHNASINNVSSQNVTGNKATSNNVTSHNDRLSPPITTPPPKQESAGSSHDLHPFHLSLSHPPPFRSPFGHAPFHPHESSPHRRASYSYESSCTASDSEIPLSMRFMHKPSRAKEMLEKQDDPTRRNSLLNAQIGYVDKAKFISSSHSSQIPMEDSDGTDKESLSSPGSPPITHKLVRKKSGEILKSSLKESSEPSYFDKKKRSRSLPTTPTYKQVHFGGDNDVKYFDRRDRPLAISALNSPTLGPSDHMAPDISDESDDDDDDDDDDDAYEERDEEGDEYFKNLRKKSPVLSTTYPNPHHDHLIDWSLELINFPPMVYERKINVNSPVFLERIFISPDKKYLLGHIAVKNLSFQKYITVRYTLDCWQTIIEIPTKYNPDGPQVLKAHDYDRFLFTVPLENLFNSFRMNNNSFDSPDDVLKHSQVKTYHLCVKYNTNNKEYWDNNDKRNYEIKLTKIIKSQGQSYPAGKAGASASTAAASTTSPKSQSRAPKQQNTKQISAHQKKPKYSNSYLKRKSHSDTQLSSMTRDYLPTPAEPTEEFVLKTPADVKEEEDSKKKLAKEFGLDSKVEQKSASLKEVAVPDFFNNDNSSSDVNDFVKNDFYLSSPMLSSYNDNALDYNTDPLEPGSLSTFKLKFKNPKDTNIDTSSNNGNTTDDYGSPKKTEFSPMERSDLDKARLTNLNNPNSKGRTPSTGVNNYIHNRKLYNTQSYKELIDNYCFYDPSRNSGIPGEFVSLPSSAKVDFNENLQPKDSSKDSDKTTTKTISSILGINK